MVIIPLTFLKRPTDFSLQEIPVVLEQLETLVVLERLVVLDQQETLEALELLVQLVQQVIIIIYI